MHAFSLGRLAQFAAGFTLLLATVSTAPAQNQPEPRAAVPSPTIRAAATRAVPRRAIVEGLTEPLHNLQITDLQGRDISAQVEPRAEAGQVTLDLAQASAIVLRSKTIQTIAAPKEGKVVLPGGAVVPIALSTATGTGTINKAIWFRLTFAASPMPAPWDEKEGSYLTHLTFGLKRPDGAPPSLSLDQPVIVKLAYQGLVAPETAMISIDGPGLENEKTIPLRFTPQSTNPTLLVRSSLNSVNVVLEALPRLAIFPDRDSILGLGLDVATVTITNIHPDGRSAPVERVTPVNVTVQGGARIEPAAVSLAVGEATTRFTVRSAGLGTIAIRANAEGILGVTTLRQTFPIGPLAAALIGGALGGFARRFVKGARRTSNPRRLIEGIVVGSVVFVAGVLGVGYLNLPAAVVSTEAGAFLTGALGGFAGVSALEMMTKKNVKSVES